MADYDLNIDTTYLDRFLDPVLDYLSSVLPPAIFSIVDALISHSIALLGALYRLACTIASSQGWDSQKILPPLITLLMAYLALVSFYRTTGWMIRTTFWFVKWGGILAALAAGAGYFMGTAQGNGVDAFNGNSLLSLLGGAFLGMVGEDSTNANANSGRSRTRSTRSSRPRSTRQQKEKERPKAWENWDKHREWQYTADAAARDDAARANEGVQEAVQKVAGFVQEALGTGWWETVKSAVEGSGFVGSQEEEGEGSQSQSQSQSQRRAKQDTKGRGSSR